MDTESVPEIDGAMSEDLLSFEEAIKYLDTSKSTLYRLLNQEDVKGVKVGKQWRFRKADLSTYLERSPVAAALGVNSRADLDAELAFFRDEELATGRTTDALTVKQALEGETPDLKIKALVDNIINLALESNASDIHLQPTVTDLRVRYRMDGVLHDVRRMPMSLHDAVISRFKEMAEMNLVERRLPQDGRARFLEYDLRMNVMPTIHGENVVIRVLDRSSSLLALDRLGTNEGELSALLPWLHRSSGLVIASGPTGAGKTTLLYSCLKEVNTDEKNVLTVEDPVEHVLADVTQIQVNRRTGLTFSAGMRSMLRQDPDVMMCGEFRDLETTNLAIEAAVTGHLVLGCLHTEDAPTAILRLVDIGVAPHLVPVTLNGVIAMRLARRLCPHCKTPEPPGGSASLREKVRRLAEQGGYMIPNDTVFYAPEGCVRCRRTGYRGRIGLYEILTCSPGLVSQIMQCNSAEERRQAAVLAGMRTLVADGVRKAAAGETSIDEVLRATGTWL